MKVEIVDSDDWCLRRWHGRERLANEDWLHWKVDDEGILVEGEARVRRTKGKPVTLSRIVASYGDDILRWADTFDLSEQLLAAIIAVESGGMPEAERYEQHLNDYSIGLTQTLTATAKQLGRFSPELPKNGLEPVPAGGLVDSWRGFLRIPENSIAYGAAYLRSANDRSDLRNDPVLLYCAYNAGSVRPLGNPWGLAHYRSVKDGKLVYAALDSFCAWYNDAVDVYGVCR